MRTQHEEIEETTGRPWKGRVIVWGLKMSFVASFCVGVTRGLEVVYHEAIGRIDEAKAVMVDKLTVTKVVTEYREVDDATLGDIIVTVAKEYSIDPLILTVIAEKESAGGKALYRFESGKFQELQSSKRYRSLSSDELRMVASSHGIFHVMGYSAQDYCQLPWHQLYNPWTSARCAATIVARLYKDTEHIQDAGTRVREVFRKFNGQGDRAEQYANDAMTRLAAMLYKGMAAKGKK
jgi:hypothetical protein